MSNVPVSTRLAVVLSHPTQYYSPWFRWLRTHTALTLRVFYLWDFGVTRRRDPKFETAFAWDVDLLAGYDHEFVPNVARDPGTHRFDGLHNPELLARLAAWRPDAVLLFGYKWRSHLRVIFWARRHGVPLIFRGDSHLLGRDAGPILKRLMLRTLFAQFAAFLPVGAANRAYFTILGVPEKKLFFAPHAVNDELFDPTRPEHQAAATALRSRLDIPPRTHVVLFAGKLVPEKQPRELLAAFLSLAATDVALIFVGEGPEKPALQELARIAREHDSLSPSKRTRDQGPETNGPQSHSHLHSAAGSIHFLPFANQSEMPSRYLLADLFVLPSRGHYETWGLAVNEAMHMGIPALVSDRVGCQRDLVSPGDTGWVFRHDDPADFRGQLGTALETLRSGAAQSALRERVRRRISKYTYAHAASGLQAALASIGTPAA